MERLNGKRPSAERALLATVVLGTMLAPLNSTMIAVALPRLIEEFDTDVTNISWLVTAYLIAMAALQPVAGKLGDRLGRRPLMLGGLAYFGLASLSATIAPNLPVLVFLRVQQAIAGALILPNGAALVREVVPAQRRAAGFGLVSAAASLTAAAGSPLGGFLIGIFGWRAIFYVNLLLVLPALLLGWQTIPWHHAEKGTRPFDLVGVVLLPAILAGTAGLLTQNHRSNTVLLLAFGSAVLVGVIALFLWHEKRHPDPVLPLRFFRHRAFASANGAVALSNLAMYVTLLALPLLLSHRKGWTSVEVGLVLAALSAAIVVGAPLGGRLADHFGRRWPTVSGLALFTLGLLPLALSSGQIGLPMLLVGLGLAGAGLGIALAGLLTAAVESLEPWEAGVASGVFSTSRYLGSIAGVSMLASLLSPMRSDVGGFGAVFLMVVVAALLSTLVSLGLHDR